ncbi:MAG: hypothetical protein ACK44M_01545 [Chloroflexus sp.]
MPSRQIDALTLLFFITYRSDLVFDRAQPCGATVVDHLPFALITAPR